MNSSLADHVLEFLECAIHSILYLRNIYPEYLFEQRRYLGILVWKSRHPDINIYVRRVLNNSKVLIEKVTIILLILCNALDNCVYVGYPGTNRCD